MRRMTGGRRQFLESVAAAGITLFAGIRPLQAADALVTVNPSQPGPVIGSHLYGHFIEHLGGVIYDGIWVGRDSKIPNVGGIRKQFVDDMRRIGAPNLRWPGGCFADGYHWRDGIGAAKRPRTYNYWENRMPAGTARGGDQRVRLSRVHAPVPARRRRALRGGECRLGDAAGVPRLGVVQQRTRRDDLPRRRARRQRREGAFQHQVLGRGQ